MNNTPAHAAFLDRLRNATSQSHTNLENLPISASIMKPDVSTQEYGHYLSLMHDVVTDAEDNIFPLLQAIVPDLNERSKKQFLETDFQTLGVVKGRNNKPLSASITNITTGFALGIMYVVEGSSLGGRVIYKNINAALGYDADNGARYFAGYGGQTGSHWKKFLDTLTQYEAETDCSSEIIAGAEFAFNVISSHFTQNGPDTV